jgi:hypothetical protein
MAGLKDREPIALQYAVAATPLVAAFALQVLNSGGVGTPAWIRAGLTGAGTLIGALGALWARRRVTSPATVADMHRDLSQTLAERGHELATTTPFHEVSLTPRELGEPQRPKQEFPAGSVDTGTGPAEVATILRRHPR